MNAFLAFVWSIFGPAIQAAEKEILTDAIAIETKVSAVAVGLIAQQPADQKRIFHDAVEQYTKDRAAGKGVGESSADALTVFFNEEGGEFSMATKKLFEAFLAATD